MFIMCLHLPDPEELLEHEADRPSVQTFFEGPTSVTAMKQACLVVILACFTLFQPNLY